MQGWDWSYRGGVGHKEVGWVIQGGCVIVQWGGSCRGRVGHAQMG